MACNHLHQWQIVQVTVLLINNLHIYKQLLQYTAVEEPKDLQCQGIQVDNLGIHLQLQITTLLYLELK
jgi:hypothetical protein